MYRKKTGKRKPAKRKMAVTRIMVVSCKMRFFRLQEFHGEGGLAHGVQQSTVVESASGSEPATIQGGGVQQDEFVVMTIHLHHATAKKDVENGSKSIKAFWDLVAGYIMEFAVRLMTGDFNMALWLAVVELRARGFQANLAAWYPWKKGLRWG